MILGGLLYLFCFADFVFGALLCVSLDVLFDYLRIGFLWVWRSVWICCCVFCDLFVIGCLVFSVSFPILRVCSCVTGLI